MTQATATPPETENLTHTGRPLLWNVEGVAVEGATSAEDVLVRAGLDWDVETRPLYVPKADGGFTIAKGRKGIVRTDTEAVLGTCRERYVPINNREVFTFLNQLVDSGDALFEAAWSHRGGEVVGITMRLPEEVLIAGFDRYQIYLLAGTTHDGGGSVRLDPTKVRLSCTNMVPHARREAIMTFRARHTSSLEGRVAEAREALEITFAEVKAFSVVAEQLAHRRVTADDIKRWSTEVFGERHADNAVVHWETSDNIADFRTNRYGALQALTEYNQWVRPRSRSLESATRGGMHKNDQRILELVTAEGSLS